MALKRIVVLKPDFARPIRKPWSLLRMFSGVRGKVFPTDTPTPLTQIAEIHIERCDGND